MRSLAFFRDGMSVKWWSNWLESGAWGFSYERHRSGDQSSDSPLRVVVGHALAWELVQTFLAARFRGAERHRRRLALAKIANLENTR